MHSAVFFNYFVQIVTSKYGSEQIEIVQPPPIHHTWKVNFGYISYILGTLVISDFHTKDLKISTTMQQDPGKYSYPHKNLKGGSHVHFQIQPSDIKFSKYFFNPF